MPDPAQPQPLHQEMLNTLNEAGAVDFGKLGQVVSDTLPKLAGPGVAADGDRIAHATESVLHVWKVLPPVGGLEAVNQLKDMAHEVQQGQVG